MEILNAKIINSGLELINTHLVLWIKILTNVGTGIELTFGIGSIEEFMRLIEIQNIKDVTGSFLRVKVKDGLTKEIGNIIENKWINPF